MLEKQGIKIIEMLYQPEKEYILAFSGGKDSIVIYDLAKKANVPVSLHCRFTIYSDAVVINCT